MCGNVASKIMPLDVSEMKISDIEDKYIYDSWQEIVYSRPVTIYYDNDDKVVRIPFIDYFSRSIMLDNFLMNLLETTESKHKLVGIIIDSILIKEDDTDGLSYLFKTLAELKINKLKYLNLCYCFIKTMRFVDTMTVKEFSIWAKKIYSTLVRMNRIYGQIIQYNKKIERKLGGEISN
jgi:hypothetical protein